MAATIGINRPSNVLTRELRNQTGETEFVFTKPDTGTRYTDIKKSFSAACREAGITNFTFHDLRHTLGTRLADAGVDVVKIKELMGHASAVTTMRYIHATDQGKRGGRTIGLEPEDASGEAIRRALRRNSVGRNRVNNCTAISN